MSPLLQRFYEHLRLDRQSKLTSAEMLEAGRFRLSRRTAGSEMIDISAEHANVLRHQISEIEQLLHEAGEPLE